VVEAVTKSRAERAAALEAWAERVQTEKLKVADTEALRVIADLADQRERVDSELTAAVRAARAAHRSWSEIGTMLGVSKQAAQRKYGHRMSA
jgi:hypothetical protein